jgi:hypothetical protein
LLNSLFMLSFLAMIEGKKCRGIKKTMAKLAEAVRSC